TVVAPIPRASERTAVIRKAGLLPRRRTAKRRSFSIEHFDTDKEHLVPQRRIGCREDGAPPKFEIVGRLQPNSRRRIECLKDHWTISVMVRSSNSVTRDQPSGVHELSCGTQPGTLPGNALPTEVAGRFGAVKSANRKLRLHTRGDVR